MIRLAFLVIALLTAITLWPVGSTYVSDWTAVDRCLDAGGSFDYGRMVCDQTTNHSFVPFRQRHQALVADAGLRLVGIMVLGLALAVRHRFRQRSSRPAV